MTEIEENSDDRSKTILGLFCARWAGRALGVGLIFWSVFILTKGIAQGFEAFKVPYILIYGLILILPFQQLKDSLWRLAYGALVVLSAGFVFVMIAAVMFAYIAAAEQGERLGVPGREGTLIFIALMQVPVVLFQRKPDLID